jgi:hypothetical protein
MEVGKLILNIAKNKVSMTLSVKPFGCMPSSGVSDGVQSLVQAMYPRGIFLPIETSGDGAVNVQSRIQMQLFKARKAAQAEVEEALAATGLTMEEVRAHIAKHSFLAHPFHKSPHRAAVTAADLVYEVFAQKRPFYKKAADVFRGLFKTAWPGKNGVREKSPEEPPQLSEIAREVARQKALARPALDRARAEESREGAKRPAPFFAAAPTRLKPLPMAQIKPSSVSSPASAEAA